MSPTTSPYSPASLKAIQMSMVICLLTTLYLTLTTIFASLASFALGIVTGMTLVALLDQPPLPTPKPSSEALALALAPGPEATTSPSPLAKEAPLASPKPSTEAPAPALAPTPEANIAGPSAAPPAPACGPETKITAPTAAPPTRAPAPEAKKPPQPQSSRTLTAPRACGPQRNGRGGRGGGQHGGRRPPPVPRAPRVAVRAEAPGAWGGDFLAAIRKDDYCAFIQGQVQNVTGERGKLVTRYMGKN
ncbi:hypothetical protein EJ04DRAFT_593509 [Polyplosphaeria fusca]|uniref:Uncharacterized protein n=1 Tax=Polyplosphaeria fusca TaxID=682080 RepID=A0A9P4QIF8_9PLEO|nr:hypothetical protein EJ04DRAFT_593509 [Polyplosphaeria fusca]